MNIDAIKTLIDKRRPALLAFNKKQTEEVFHGLNIFEMVSDIYYRENMHSDVLQALLATNSTHGEKDKYLRLFIELLRKQAKDKIDFELQHIDIVVSREEGRRDITIQNHKQAIIIENKINDAGDTTNQIPTYYYQLKNNKIDVVAIVYLTLSQGKEPDRTTWRIENESDRLDIEQKLICIRTFDGTTNDLISGWLTPCIHATTDQNNIAVLKQYKAILQNLSKNLLDMDYMEEFVKQLNEEVNFKAALDIKENIEKLPTYIGLKFKNYFSSEERYKPFKGIRMYNLIPYFDGFEVNGNWFNTDVIFSLDKCEIDFSVRNKEIMYTQEIPEKVLKAIGMESEFVWNNNGRFVHVINENIIKGEKLAIAFVEKFLKQLIDKKNEIESELSGV